MPIGRFTTTSGAYTYTYRPARPIDDTAVEVVELNDMQKEKIISIIDSDINYNDYICYKWKLMYCLDGSCALYINGRLSRYFLLAQIKSLNI